MSRKHNTKHNRKPSNYPKKTEGKHVRMPSLFELRKAAGATLNGRPITSADLREVKDM